MRLHLEFELLHVFWFEVFHLSVSPPFWLIFTPNITFGYILTMSVNQDFLW